MTIIDQFHFLRPQWLWAIIPLIMLLWLMARRRRTGKHWEAVCDPQLLPHILMQTQPQGSRWPLIMAGLAGLLTILALAGPAWKMLEQPVFRQQSALVMILDLSRSMDATDIKPSRLQRAKHKVMDILSRRREGQTALIVYAAQAFTVSPLTDDSATIAALVPTLDTTLMPAQGSDTAAALDKAVRLLKQAGASEGDMLLLTDGADATAAGQAETLRRHGYRISVLGIGTPQGAPIPARGGGFVKDDRGQIVVPRLDGTALRRLAGNGGGHYHALSADDADLDALLADHAALNNDTTGSGHDRVSDRWREEGVWLLLLILPLSALIFRRGYLLLLPALLLPLPQAAQALTWQNLWARPDQRAAAALQQGDAATAARLFQDPQWKAAALYRNGQYQQSSAALAGIKNADALYNRGNALARLGRFDAAIQSYDEALKLDAGHDDARYNKALIERYLAKQQQNEQHNGDGKGAHDEQHTGRKSQDQGRQGDSADNAGNADNSGGDQRQTDDTSTADADTDASENTGTDATPAAAQQSGQRHDRQGTTTTADGDRPDQAEQIQADEQWLRRIPDDPGGLLRRKFKYQYSKQANTTDSSQPW